MATPAEEHNRLAKEWLIETLGLYRGGSPELTKPEAVASLVALLSERERSAREAGTAAERVRLHRLLQYVSAAIDPETWPELDDAVVAELTDCSCPDVAALEASAREAGFREGLEAAAKWHEVCAEKLNVAAEGMDWGIAKAYREQSQGHQSDAHVIRALSLPTPEPK